MKLSSYLLLSSLLCVHGRSEFENSESFDQRIHETVRNLRFSPIPNVCKHVSTAISRAPSALLRNMTDPSIYDMKQRPNNAPISRGPYKGREPSTIPDNVTYAQLISSVDQIDMYNQEITIR
jgi:hypothetical protein